MNLRHRPVSALLLSAVLLATGCASPLVNLGTLATKTVSVNPSDARLIFHTPSGAKFLHAIGDAGYLTVDLRSMDGTTHFFATTVKDVNGDYVVVINGLTAGDWRLRVFLYSDALTPNLYFYARQTQYVAPGSSTPIALALYEPGALGTVSPDLILEADHIVLDPAAGNSVLTPKPMTDQSRFSLLATVFSSTASSAPPPLDPANPLPDEYVTATEQGVLWSSSDPQVASVTSSGKVIATGPGIATIKAVSVDLPTVQALFYVKVTKGLEGTWKSAVPLGNALVFRFTDTNWESYEWDPTGSVGFGNRGTYSIAGNRLTLITDGILPNGTTVWAPYAFDPMNPRVKDSGFSITDNTLALWNFVGAPSVGMTLNSVAVDNPLEIAEVTLVDEPGSVARYVGTTLNLSSVIVGNGATIDHLVWKEVYTNPDTPALNFFPLANGSQYTMFPSVIQARSVTVEGYPLGSATPLVSRTFTTLADAPAVTSVTLNSPWAPYTQSLSPGFNIEASFGFSVIQNLEFTVSGTPYPVAITEGSPQPYTIGLPATLPGDGTYSIDVRAQNKAGTWSAPLAVNVVVDTLGPSVSTSDLSMSAGFMALTPISFTVTLGDAGVGVTGATAPTVTVGGNAMDMTGGGGIYTATYTPGLPSGTYTVQVTAYDNLGNSSPFSPNLEVNP